MFDGRGEDPSSSNDSYKGLSSSTIFGIRGVSIRFMVGEFGTIVEGVASCSKGQKGFWPAKRIEVTDDWLWKAPLSKLLENNVFFRKVLLVPLEVIEVVSKASVESVFFDPCLEVCIKGLWLGAVSFTGDFGHREEVGDEE